MGRGATYGARLAFRQFCRQQARLASIIALLGRGIGFVGLLAVVQQAGDLFLLFYQLLLLLFQFLAYRDAVFQSLGRGQKCIRFFRMRFSSFQLFFCRWQRFGAFLELTISALRAALRAQSLHPPQAALRSQKGFTVAAVRFPATS